MKQQLSVVAKRMRLGGGTNQPGSESESQTSHWRDLTDDLFFEILGRLPAKDVHRFKCVSKRWFSIISEPSFARSYILRHISLSEDTIKKMLIFKVHLASLGQVGQLYSLPLPLPHNDFQNLFPFAFDFIPALRPHNYDLRYYLAPRGLTERVLTDMAFLGASGGLVLLQGAFHDRTDTVSYSRNYYYYYVCNPVTKEWVELPLISFNFFIGFTCYYQRQGQDTRFWAHTTSFDDTVTHIADYDPNKIEFTVISINMQKDDNAFVIRVFSSEDETPGWRIFGVPFPRGYKWREIIGRRKAIFLNGKFYWCGEHCIAAYDPFNKPLECEIIPFPPMDSSEMKECDYMFVEACNGRLVLRTLVMFERAIVWELVDYANKVWVKKFDFQLEIECDHGLRFHSFVGGVAGDKAYVSEHGYPTTRILDLKNGSQQDLFEHPFELDIGGSVEDAQTFISSPWPTPVPLRDRK